MHIASNDDIERQIAEKKEEEQVERIRRQQNAQAKAKNEMIIDRDDEGYQYD